MSLDHLLLQFTFMLSRKEKVVKPDPYKFLAAKRHMAKPSIRLNGYWPVV
jgi:hypothetical protein